VGLALVIEEVKALSRENRFAFAGVFAMAHDACTGCYKNTEEAAGSHRAPFCLIAHCMFSRVDSNTTHSRFRMDSNCDDEVLPITDSLQTRSRAMLHQYDGLIKPSHFTMTMASAHAARRLL
jgi:hypothetical protein